MHRYELENLSSSEKNINIFKGCCGCDVHTHKFVELVFIFRGSCTQYIDERQYTAKEGDLLFINYNQTHSFTDCENLLYYNIEYVPDFFGRELINSENIYDIFEYVLLDDNMGKTPFPFQKISFSGKELESVKNIILDMESEFINKQPGYRSVLNGCSRILFSKILRNAHKEKMTDSESINKIVLGCMQYIDKNCFGKLTLDEIAQKTFYNPSYLSRIFKKYCGQNLWDYIKEKRIAEAGRLLKETDGKIESVMAQVGYSDRKIFYRHFKDFFGKTPAEYRKK